MLQPHSTLAASSRLRVIAPHGIDALSRPAAADVALLLFCGAFAACCTLLWEWHLKMPGHAILQTVLPLAGGLALVFRRGGGTVMAAGALATVGLFAATGWGEKGLGSLTSLLLTGPLLDLALWRVRSGWGVYSAFAIAGLASNVAALGVQIVAKLIGWGGGGKPLAMWLPTAAVTYPFFGLAAGLLAALILFRPGGGEDAA